MWYSSLMGRPGFAAAIIRRWASYSRSFSLYSAGSAPSITQAREVSVV